MEELLVLFAIFFASVKDEAGRDLVARIAKVDPLWARQDKDEVGDLLVESPMGAKNLVGVPQNAFVKVAIQHSLIIILETMAQLLQSVEYALKIHRSGHNAGVAEHDGWGQDARHGGPFIESDGTRQVAKEE